VNVKLEFWRRAVDRLGRVLLFCGALLLGSLVPYAPRPPALTPYARLLEALAAPVGYADLVLILSVFGFILLPIARLGLPIPRPRWITLTTVETLLLGFLIGMIVRNVDTWLNS
jgi:hypothetical protein